MLPHHISPSFQELKVVRFWFVGSCQLNSRLIKSKFVSEFVGTDKPTKFVSCRFVGSCQLNSRLIKSKFISCPFVSSCQLNPCLIKSKFVSEFVGTDKPTEILHSFAEKRICKG